MSASDGRVRLSHITPPATRPIYGLNTGLGGNLGHRIPTDEIAAFQHQIVRGRAVGVGPAIADDIVRAALLARIVELAIGATGVSEAAIEALIALFNADINARGSKLRLDRTERHGPRRPYDQLSDRRRRGHDRRRASYRP